MRRAKDLSYEEISKYFSCPIHQACIYLKVERTDLKRRCEELQIKKWPYRQYQRKNVQPPSGMFDSFHASEYESVSPVETIEKWSSEEIKLTKTKKKINSVIINVEKEPKPTENLEEKQNEPKLLLSKMSISNLLDEDPEK